MLKQKHLLSEIFQIFYLQIGRGFIVMETNVLVINTGLKEF